jgi:hypothetical protein
MEPPDSLAATKARGLLTPTWRVVIRQMRHTSRPNLMRSECRLRCVARAVILQMPALDMARASMAQA